MVKQKEISCIVCNIQKPSTSEYRKEKVMVNNKATIQKYHRCDLCCRNTHESCNICKKFIELKCRKCKIVVYMCVLCNRDRSSFCQTCTSRIHFYCIGCKTYNPSLTHCARHSNS